ncbi:MAG: hypothetical protein ACOYMG_11265 [Candidatus Methylumidiphilus sp.]
MKPTGLWVVKLGGSLAGSPRLSPWLEALSQTSAVIVPGGGPFADRVRQAQARWHFNDITAHHMAIVAMRQYGRMLVGLCPKLLAATRLEDLARRQNQAVVWLPSPGILDAAGIPATWDITSDSLAAWLAGQLHAENLLLVKSVAELDEPTDGLREIPFAEAADTGWVDLAFDRYAMNQSFQSWLCGPGGHAMQPQAFTEPERIFTLLRK